MKFRQEFKPDVFQLTVGYRLVLKPTASRVLVLRSCSFLKTATGNRGKSKAIAASTTH